MNPLTSACRENIEIYKNILSIYYGCLWSLVVQETTKTCISRLTKHCTLRQTHSPSLPSIPQSSTLISSYSLRMSRKSVSPAAHT